MKTTKQRIKNIAIELFSAYRYDKVSVVSISRDAGITNSVFYYYFDNKEQLFKEILNDLFYKLDNAFGKITGDTSAERLKSMLTIHAVCNTQYDREIAIYREGEFIYPEFDHALKAIYHSSLEIVFQRSVSIAEYYYFIGGIRFISSRMGADGISSRINDLQVIITGGIFIEDITLNLETITSHPVITIQTDNSTRMKMIQAGLELIGKQGFDKTQIFEICSKSGYSVGMLYKLFKNKQNFLATLVVHLNKFLCNYLNQNKLELGNRTDKEIRRLYIFIEFFRMQKHLYNLLREAEFTSPEYLQNFYNGMEEVYLKDLGLISNTNNQLTVNYLMGIAHYLCGEVLFSEEAPDIQFLLTEIGHLLHSGIVLNSDGLK